MLWAKSRGISCRVSGRFENLVQGQMQFKQDPRKANMVANQNIRRLAKIKGQGRGNETLVKVCPTLGPRAQFTPHPWWAQACRYRAFGFLLWYYVQQWSVHLWGGQIKITRHFAKLYDNLQTIITWGTQGPYQGVENGSEISRDAAHYWASINYFRQPSFLVDLFGRRFVKDCQKYCSDMP